MSDWSVEASRLSSTSTLESAMLLAVDRPFFRYSSVKWWRMVMAYSTDVEIAARSTRACAT